MSVLGSISTNVFPLFYEVARVARYVVLARSIGGVTAPGPGPEIIGSEWAPHFDLPGVVIEAPAVLFFTTKPQSSGTRISVRLQSAADHLLQYVFADDTAQSWHLIIRPLLLKAEDNELLFNVYDGDSATFSDAVILYTSDQLTVKRSAGEVLASR